MTILFTILYTIYNYAISFRVLILSPHNSIDLYLHLFTASQKYEIFLSALLEVIVIKIDSLMDV